MSDYDRTEETEPSRGMNGLIDRLSIEIPLNRVAAFDPDHAVLPRGSLVFLPHLGGQEASEFGAACRLLVDYGYTPVPHVGARHLPTEQAYRAHLRAAADNGADRLLVLAGDRNSSLGPYASALDLIRSPHFGEFGFGTVMIGGYPEGHPRIGRAALDAAMREKLVALQRLGRDVVIVSQFAFDPTAYVSWVRTLRDSGITNRIRLGVAGVTSLPSLIKYAVMCGIGPSLSVLQKRSSAILGLLGSYTPETLLLDIAVGLDTQGLGDVDIHFFPFGGAAKTLNWVRSARSENARK